MSKSIHELNVSELPDRHLSVDIDETDVLDALGDGKARAILSATDSPKTVAELEDELGMSQSTMYRKLTSLEAAGLLSSTRSDPIQSSSSRFRRVPRSITVYLDD